MVLPEDYFKKLFPVLLEGIMARLENYENSVLYSTSLGISEEVEKTECAPIHKTQTST